MFSAEATTLAQQLNDATRAGNLGVAYQVIAKLQKDVLHDVMLSAGFAAVPTTDPKFTAHAQRQIAEACKGKLDGRTYTHNRREAERHGHH